MQFPCAKCGAARQSLEAACDNCGWSPEPMTTPRRRSGEITGRGIEPVRRTARNWRIRGLMLLCPAVLIALILFSKAAIRDLQPATPTVHVSIEVFVQDSQPAMPGTTVDVVTMSKPRQLLVGNTRIMGARWKVPGPFQAPTYPAQGFVSLELSEDERDVLRRAGEVSVFPAGQWDSE